MTTPGGAPGLPTGSVLTLANIESRLQDLTAGAMKGRALDWFPSLAGSTTGLNPALAFTPFGILVDIWSRFNHLVATANPNDINSVADLDNLFVEFVTGLPLIGQYIDLLEAFTGTYTGDDATLQSINNLFQLIPLLNGVGGVLSSGSLQPLIDAVSQGFGGGAGLNFTGLQSLLSAVPGGQQVLDTLVGTFLGLGGSGFGQNDLIRALQSIPGSFLTGPLAPGQASNVSVGTISSVVPEFLVNPNFDTANSIIGQNAWTWDGTQGPGGGVTTSVFTDASGVLKELFSNTIHVQPGQVLNVIGNTMWGNTFNGGANSIALTVAKYDIGNTFLGYDTLTSVAAPGPSGPWQQLTNAYTIPAGVTSIFLRPTVDSSATTGRVWFGKMSVKPSTNTVQETLVPPLSDNKVPGLQDLLTQLLGGFTGFISPDGSVPTQQVVGDATSNQTAQIAQLAASVSALTAQLASQQTGTIVAVDAFNRNESNLGTDWDVETITAPFFGGGYPRTDGSQAIWVVGGIGPATSIARFIGTNHTAAGDNTETVIVLGSPLSVTNGAVDIHGRMSADRQTSIRARILNTGSGIALQLHSRVSGAETLIGTQPLPNDLAVGTSGKLICGTTVSSRQFIVIINNQQYAMTESGTTSQLGSGFRERGMGWYAGPGGFFGFGEAQAGAVAHWTSIDIGSTPFTPPPTGTPYDGGAPAGQDPGFITYDGGTPAGSGATYTIDGGSP